LVSQDDIGQHFLQFSTVEKTLGYKVTVEQIAVIQATIADLHRQ
jgi:hypothetical protein